jgi:hypothetical protein
MMSFSACMTGFLMNFELLPILTDDHRTQFWKEVIQESFQQSFVEIGSVVSEKIFFKFHPPFFLICIIGQNRQKFLKITFKSSPLKPLKQIKPNLAGMVPGWVPFKIVSHSPALHSRWPLLLK